MKNFPPFSIFQFAAWVDAVIFVFSLENEASFNAIYTYYTKMAHYRNSGEIPIILVGTQGEFFLENFPGLIVNLNLIYFQMLLVTDLPALLTTPGPGSWPMI